jgi:hypothetical protein
MVLEVKLCWIIHKCCTHNALAGVARTMHQQRLE